MCNDHLSLRTTVLRQRVSQTGRGGLARAGSRLRAAPWSIGQCVMAASLAFFVAQHLLGHPRPFFSAVAAVVCLGTRQAQRLSRVAQLAAGVSVGVLVGDLFVGLIGSGAWQIGLVVVVAVTLAVVLNGGPLLVSQSGVQAVLVVALPSPPGTGFNRWEDALVGGAVALAVAALLPADPWRAGRRASATAVRGLALALRETAEAVTDHDVTRAGDALGLARDTQAALTRWADELATGHDVARLSLLRRGSGERTYRRLRGLQVGLDQASRNSRVLVRRVLAALEVDDVLPAELPGLLEAYAGLLDRLVVDPDEPGLLPAVTAYAGTLEAALGSCSLSAAVAIAQLRAAVVDLLEALGVPHDLARERLPTLGPGATVEPSRSRGDRDVDPGPGSSRPGERP